MTGKLEEIRLYKRKGEKPIIVQQAELIQNGGIVGDRHCNESARQISIMSSAIETWMQEQSVEGLCFEKFGANLVISGISEEEFLSDNILCIGDVQIKLCGFRKKCFPKECHLYQEGLDCKLSKARIFAQGIQDGVIYTGDIVTIKKATTI